MIWDDKELKRFKDIVWQYFKEHRRQFDWRVNTDPYWVFVSEIMLQQTQTSRVADKFPIFIQLFPNFQALSQASLAAVLTAWQGLGYNRRARYMHQAAQIIADKYQGQLPGDQAALEALPGIGKNTAASILAYAFNIPSLFIETNIRTVFIHHFFKDQIVNDRQIETLVAQTQDPLRPREWYWALMDYGVYLKKTVGNLSRQSSHYVKQSQFTGSLRQKRGQLIRILLERQADYTSDSHLRSLSGETPSDRSRHENALKGLVDDGLVVCEVRDGECFYRVG